jgi:two-component system cell cycle sensor histidine kinase/response regulator CckA
MDLSVSSIVLALTGLVAGFVVGALSVLRRRRTRDETSTEDAEAMRWHLQRAQRMEALGILSGSIMHNLNNLLSVVIGQARMARDDVSADSPAWERLGQVVQAGEAAAELTREVDGYQSQSDHERGPVRLQPVVRATVKLLRDILPDTVQIETSLDPDCGPVLASTTQVQQVLMSLCSNSYHAMYRRRGRITVSVSRVELDEPRAAEPRTIDPGVYVQLSVADNGRGMDPETLKHIFEPYFSSRGARRGAGLGLTMVSRLLAANEGATVASSLPGHGTRFDIYFPLIARGVRATPAHLSVVEAPAAAGPAPETVTDESPAYEAPAIAAVGDAAGSETNGSRPARILLVEDDTMVADTVQTCLRRAGMLVTAHTDGAAAVAAFAAEPGAYDLLLTDQFMRGLDGREVIAEARRYRPRLPVVLMSGHPDGLRTDENARLGISATLAKPFTPAELLDVARQAMRSALKAREGQA